MLNTTTEPVTGTPATPPAPATATERMVRELRSSLLLFFSSFTRPEMPSFLSCSPLSLPSDFSTVPDFAWIVIRPSALSTASSSTPAMTLLYTTFTARDAATPAMPPAAEPASMSEQTSSVESTWMAPPAVTLTPLPITAVTALPGVYLGPVMAEAWLRSSLFFSFTSKFSPRFALSVLASLLLLKSWLTYPPSASNLPSSPVTPMSDCFTPSPSSLSPRSSMR